MRFYYIFFLIFICVFNVENSYLINRNLQNAILSSLNSEDYQSSSSDEEIDIFEAFYEDDE